MNLLLTSPDPLGVLASTRGVAQHGRFVRLSPDGAASVAANIQHLTPPSPAWGDDLHFAGETWQTAGWVLVLDALNFCFWSEHAGRRWRVARHGEMHDGYWALVAALRRSVDEGYPLWDAGVLSQLDLQTTAHLLRPSDPGDPVIPLLEDRHHNLVDLGEGLLAFHASCGAPASISPVTSFIQSAGGSAVRLVELVTTWFSSFADTTIFEGAEVRFFKRAQILAADLNAALTATGDPGLTGLSALTAFADYKVPQVLRRLGVIDYAEELARTIDAQFLIPAGSREEVEIRAATIWGVELIRQELERLHQPMTAAEIDWALWQAGQVSSAGDHPYHRTLTIFY
ncbi:MAG: queuosine salvage family protein [Thermomicrobiales bacterium]|nr:queuosine salvage family protein [Thermomicrobiales bacterium]